MTERIDLTRDGFNVDRRDDVPTDFGNNCRHQGIEGYRNSSQRESASCSLACLPDEVGNTCVMSANGAPGPSNTLRYRYEVRRNERRCIE